MSEAEAPAARPDIDIRADVEEFIVHYPPTNNDRFHLDVDVRNGVVILSGYVKTLNTHDYLLGNLPTIKGIAGVQTDRLYIDEQIRLEVGQVIPAGVNVNVEYGVVVLTGKLTEDASEDRFVGRIASIPGVNRVITALRD